MRDYIKWYKDSMVQVIIITFLVWYLSMATLLLCSGCIMNSNITLGGVSTLQSPRDNEAATSKQGVQEVEEVEDMNSTGILPWLLDKTLGHK